MAKFEVLVKTVEEIVEHGNADTLEVAKVGGFRSVVRKGTYEPGDLVVVFPEHAILPDPILQMLNLWDADKNHGRLAGAKGNRVKPTRLRGQLSEVVLGRVDQLVPESEPGQDVAQDLGVVKYVVSVPKSMNGSLVDALGYTIRNWDIENYAKFQNENKTTFVLNEPVVVTEKLHGTWCGVGWHQDFGWVVSSKGFSHAGQAFDLEDEVNRNKNVYVNWFLDHIEQLETLRDLAQTQSADSFHLLGELVGPGIQDLHYCLEDKEFFGFDMKVGSRWLDYWKLDAVLAKIEVRGVPLIDEFDFDEERVTKVMRDCDAEHVLKRRLHWSCFEGFVIRSVNSHKQLKLVHEDYLTGRGRKHPTDFQ